MELQTAFETRRSIRHYDAEKKVTKEQVETLIKAASLAPSWKNTQTSRYYCVLSEDKVAEFSQKCLPEFNQKNSAGAGALIVTTFVKGLVGFDNDGNPVNEAGDGWGYYDLGLQNENLLLKATELGLDTLVMGIRDGEAIREMLNIPETENVVAVIAVGYKAKEANMPKRKELEEKIAKQDFEHEDVLGDIIISIEKVKEQAIEYGHSFERELSYMLVHGFYHLMGYDHIKEEDKKEMRPKEEKILNELKITRD